MSRPSPKSPGKTAPIVPAKIIQPPTGPSPQALARSAAAVHYKAGSSLEQVMADESLDGDTTLNALALLRTAGLHKDV